MAEPELLTVDQLAERTRTSVRTIRYYSGRGLLPPPQLRGRTGLYGPDHVARLQLVAELTELGFTLAAVERYLERVPASAGPEELALQLALLTPWAPEHHDEDDRDAPEERGDLPADFWRRSREIIDRHAAALAEELMSTFQEEVLQPYRDAGRPAVERARLASGLSQLKPVTVQRLVMAFGRAMNRTIRARASESLSPMTLAGE